MKYKKLSKKQKELLREFVKYTCSQCHKKESECGTLQVHRIKHGGPYNLGNIQLICKKCHKTIHWNEY